MKFQDNDIAGFSVFDNGVVLQVMESNLLDAVDGDNQVALYLYEQEINTLIDKVDRQGREAYESAVTAEFDFCINGAHIEQSTIIFAAELVKAGTYGVAQEDISNIFISLDLLMKVKNKINAEQKRQADVTAFNEAFKEITGCKLGVAKDSNMLVMEPA